MMNKEKIFNDYCEYLDYAAANSPIFKSFLITGKVDESFDISYGYVAVGATRATIIDESSDYVVKVDIATDEWGDSSCEREMNIISAAKEQGLLQYFTDGVYLGEYCRTFEWYNVVDFDTWMTEEDFWNAVERDELKLETFTVRLPLYGYQKADCDSYRQVNSSEDDEKYVRSHKSPLSQRSMKVALAFLTQYGADVYEELSEFCNEWNINDLHNGNIGYVHNQVVFVDFAGYHSYS